MRTDPLSFLADEINTLKSQGLYRRLRVLDDRQAARTTIDGRQVINLSSNNYLGLTTHPRLKEKALAVHRAGIKKIIAPSANKSEWPEMPQTVKRDLEFSWVETMDQVIDIILHSADAQPAVPVVAPDPEEE